MTDRKQDVRIDRIKQVLLEMGLEDAWPLPEALTEHAIRKAAEDDSLLELVKEALAGLVADGRVIIYRGLWSDNDPQAVSHEEALALIADSRWYSYPEIHHPAEERVHFANAELGERRANPLRVVWLTHSQCAYVLSTDFDPVYIRADVAQAARRFETTPPPRTVVVEIAHHRAEAFRAACTTRLAEVGFDESYRLTDEGAMLESLIDAFCGTPTAPPGGSDG